MKEFKGFTHRECEFFDECHGGAEKNCLFCYCPLYHIDCPGTPEYTRDGVKDCKNCLYPHVAENYDEIVELLKRQNEKNGRIYRAV